MCEISRGDVVTSSWLKGEWIVGYRGRAENEDFRWLFPKDQHGPSILIHESRIIPPGQKRDRWDRKERA